MRVAIYARVSTKDGRQCTDNQLVQLREFSASQRWDMFCEYVDHESGRSGDRAQFKAMLSAASRRHFDVLLFWSLDRLTREGALHTLQYLNELSSYGVGFRSFTEPYLDSCGIFKDAVIAILGTIAKQESVRLSERVRAGLDRARAAGKSLGRPRVVVDVGRVKALRAAGASWSQVCESTGLSMGTAQRAAAR